MIDLPKANYIEWNVKSVIKLNERDTYTLLMMEPLRKNFS